MVFFYRVSSRYGSIANLTVYTKTSANAAENVLWEMGGDQGNEWHRQRVKLPRTSTFQIIFEAEHSPGYFYFSSVDLSIDDVSFEPCSAPSKKYKSFVCVLSVSCWLTNRLSLVADIYVSFV